MGEEQRSYEFFDHTADVGVHVCGETLTEVFVRAARALTELIAEDSAIQPTQDRPITLHSEDARALLLAWLSELLFWFSTDGFLPCAFELESVTEMSLCGRLRGERFDPARHTYGTEVKGITRHQLSLERKDGQWEAQVIFDV